MVEAERARHLLDSLEVAQRLGIWEWTPSTGEMVWSDGLYEILDVPPATAPSMDGLIATLHPSDRPRFETHLSRARLERGLLAFRCHSGAHRLLQVRMQRTLADDGSLRSIVGTNQDITDEEIATDPATALVTLTGAIAHEINNPLAVISAVLQMMPASVATRDALDAVDRICAAVGDLNLYAQGDRAARHTLHLEQVTAVALDKMRDLDKRATVTSRLDPTLAVRATPATVTRMVIELVENALDAVAASPRKEVQVATRKDGREWSVLEISDSGTGIPSTTMPRVFEPFFTTRGVGRRGMGLPICRGIVDSLGGSITIHGREGGGTRVMVAFPTTASQPSVKPPPLHEAKTRAKRGRVLIVDDEVLFTNALSRLLSAEHECQVVHDGRAALDLVANGNRFDVIVSDVTMPVMTGIELHTALLDLAPEQAERMIFVTGRADVVATELLSRVESFEKPCDVAELRDAVRRRVTASLRRD